MPHHHGGPVDAKALAAVRKICAALPGAVETTTFGHPAFQAGPKRTFAVLDDHEQPGLLCLVLKLEVEQQAALVDAERFFASKFGARHGWTSLRIDAGTDWAQARGLILDSYRRVAPKRWLQKLGQP
jgi:predicted DNA-binding protein (MmcQ/YjbR family)